LKKEFENKVRKEIRYKFPFTTEAFKETLEENNLGYLL
jgi:hypothetical protein